MDAGIFHDFEFVVSSSDFGVRLRKFIFLFRRFLFSSRNVRRRLDVWRNNQGLHESETDRVLEHQSILKLPKCQIKTLAAIRMPDHLLVPAQSIVMRHSQRGLLISWQHDWPKVHVANSACLPQFAQTGITTTATYTMAPLCADDSRYSSTQ